MKLSQEAKDLLKYLRQKNGVKIINIWNPAALDELENAKLVTIDTNGPGWPLMAWAKE